MFRNSLNQSSQSAAAVGVDMNPNSSMESTRIDDEYFEFDGATLEIKHNASIRQSGVSIGPKIVEQQQQSSILQGSDSAHSPTREINPITRMTDTTTSANTGTGERRFVFRTPL